MTRTGTKDIQDIILETEHAEILASDQTMDSASKASSLSDFIRNNAADIISLLNELKTWRTYSGAEESGSHIFDKQSRVIVEGFSDNSAAAALSDALNKASRYFSEKMDINITLRQLSEIKDGGHRAVLELHIIPMNLGTRSHVQSLDVENKKFHDLEFHHMLKKEEAERRHLVFDHYVGKIGSGADSIPDYFLINLGDACLMNYMIEKEFFKAGHALSAHPTRVLIKTVKEDPEP
ncbi:MAG: hypothetical protein PHX61_03215 [Alphaproteobacteria bacterium]|nr:hypothetical protein [Alphaproteobacteria bacterium]